MTDSSSERVPEVEATDQPTRIAYTIEELCQVMGISRAMIYREVKAQRLRVRKVGARTVAPVDEVRAWLEI